MKEHEAVIQRLSSSTDVLESALGILKISGPIPKHTVYGNLETNYMALQRIKTNAPQLINIRDQLLEKYKNTLKKYNKHAQSIPSADDLLKRINNIKI